MSWMSEISIMIETARAFGVTLEMGDFRRMGDRLTIDGMDADDWLSAMTFGADDVFESSFFPDTLEEME